MKYFLCRLIPPRPTFAQDMTEAEAMVMRDHVSYWTELAGRGTAVVFGPVADPKGPWGIGILEVADEAEVQSLTANDPVIRAAIGARYEILPMPRAVMGKKRQPV
jgi:uncharacterized protein